MSEGVIIVVMAGGFICILFGLWTDHREKMAKIARGVYDPPREAEKEQEDKGQ